MFLLPPSLLWSGHRRHFPRAVLTTYTVHFRAGVYFHSSLSVRSVVLIKYWGYFGCLFMFKALDCVSCFVSRDCENQVHLFTLNERGYSFTHWLIGLGSRIGNGGGEKNHCHCNTRTQVILDITSYLTLFTVIRVPIYVSIYLWFI